MRCPITIAAIIVLLLAAGAAATDVDGLHSAWVPVADRSEAEFRRGIAKALEIVIVKLTGDRAAPKSKSGRGVVGQAKRLVQQFSYEVLRYGGSSTEQLMLRVEFDARVVNANMRSRGLVVWGKERPDTLFWLVVDDSTGGRYLLGADHDDELIRVITARARVRGVPILFPIADIAESSAVADAVSDIALEQALKTSSVKYGLRSILIGQLRQVIPGVWENRWTLSVEDESLTWMQRGDFLSLLVEEATDLMADALGRRYATPLSVHTDVVAVTVNGVVSALDYARTERYLRSLDSVIDLFVRQVDGADIVFDITVAGGLAALTQSIAFGRMLDPDPVDAAVFRLIAN